MIEGVNDEVATGLLKNLIKVRDNQHREYSDYGGVNAEYGLGFRKTLLFKTKEGAVKFYQDYENYNGAKYRLPKRYNNWCAIYMIIAISIILFVGVFFVYIK